jgi:hypothetical protein
MLWISLFVAQRSHYDAKLQPRDNAIMQQGKLRNTQITDETYPCHEGIFKYRDEEGQTGEKYPYAPAICSVNPIMRLIVKPIDLPGVGDLTRCIIMSGTHIRLTTNWSEMKMPLVIQARTKYCYKFRVLSRT